MAYNPHIGKTLTAAVTRALTNYENLLRIFGALL